MFKAEDIKAIDRKYFTIIVANEYDITLISNNTHHVWYPQYQRGNPRMLKKGLLAYSR